MNQNPSNETPDSRKKTTQTQSFPHDSSIRSATLVVAITGSFIVPFMGSSVNVILPAIEKNLNIDAVLLSWVATAYLLAAGITLVPMGRLADIIGRKKILGLGFSLFALGSLAVSMVQSFPMFMFFRTLQGMGSGMIFGTSMAILTSVFPPKERGKVLGVTTSAVYVGLSSGPFVAGILVQQIGWRVLFLLTFILSFIPLLFILTRLKGEWADAAGEKYDIPGAFIFGIALFGLVYGFSKLPGTVGLVLLAIGIPAMIVFILRQIRIPSPLIDVSLFTQNRVFARSNLAALIHYGSTFGLNFLLSLYLQYIKGLSPQTTGVILISQPIMMALGSPFAGRLSDKVEPRILATTGMSMTCVGILVLSFLQPSTPIFLIVCNLVFLGCGFALFSSPNMNAIMSSVEKRHLGLASGSAATMRLMGQMFSMGIVTMMISLLMGKAQISPETYPALLQCIRISFSLFSGLCVLGIFASFSRGNVR
jgi:EmrB/QacA subfamily drug resistance transporter